MSLKYIFFKVYAGMGLYIFAHDFALWGKNQLSLKSSTDIKLPNRYSKLPFFLILVLGKMELRFKAETCDSNFTECSCCYIIMINTTWTIVVQCFYWHRCEGDVLLIPELLAVTMTFGCKGKSTIYSCSSKNKKGFYSNVLITLAIFSLHQCWKAKQTKKTLFLEHL